MRWAALVLALILGNHATLQSFYWPMPPISSVPLSARDATQNIFLASLGMRRLAADLAFIRLLMYYGTPESGEDGHGHSHETPFGAGHYPELLERSLRILDLDPYFSYAALYGAGALAFNLGRPQEAVRVLQYASARNPKEWKYRAYLAAIGFQHKGDALSILRELSPVVDDPDCPTMIKNLVAFLNLRAGRRGEARRIYRSMLESRDPAYQEVARRALEKLGAS